MENQEQNQYFILFPSYLLEQLSPHECILMGVLISLSKRDGYAYPSNQMLCKTLNTSMATIGRMLTKLENSGYITRKIYKDEQGQIIARHIYITESLVRGGITKNDNTPSTEMITTLLPESIIPHSQNRELIINTNKKEIDKKQDINGAFELIWERYQKKGNRKTSYSAFLKLKKEDMRAVWNHIPIYVDAHIKAGKIEFLPHLSTYLNQRRWEDTLPYQDSKQNISNQVIDWNG